MFDWLWKGVAGAAGLAALWFGISADRSKRRIERERQEREAAEKSLVEKSIAQLAETRKQYANRAPIDPNKRTDFE